jgi:hypothetical protein
MSFCYTLLLRQPTLACLLKERGNLVLPRATRLDARCRREARVPSNCTARRPARTYERMGLKCLSITFLFADKKMDTAACPGPNGPLTIAAAVALIDHTRRALSARANEHRPIS